MYSKFTNTVGQLTPQQFNQAMDRQLAPTLRRFRQDQQSGGEAQGVSQIVDQLIDEASQPFTSPQESSQPSVPQRDTQVAPPQSAPPQSAPPQPSPPPSAPPSQASSTPSQPPIQWYLWAIIVAIMVSLVIISYLIVTG